MKKIVLFANTEWYLFNFRRSLALSLVEAGYEVVLVSPEGPYGKKLLDLGIRWQPLPMERRSLNPFKEVKALFYLWKLIRREKPSLIHSFTLKSAIYGAFVSRLAGVKMRVSGIDGLGYVFTSRGPKARLLRPFIQILLKVSLGGGGHRLILQNQDDVSLFVTQKLVPPGTIHLIPGAGVDSNKYHPGLKMTTSNKPLRVLLAARLLWAKGIGEYVEASRILKERKLDVEFLLAGAPDQGNPAAVPEESVRAWHEEGLIRWLGHVADMPSLLASVDIVTLPSYYREGLPTCLTEAGAMGIPLITTDSPGCREAVTHELNGLLVPPKDPRALADAVARLYNDTELTVRLGLSSRKRVLEEFDERIIIRRTIEVYQELREEVESASPPHVAG